MDNRLLVGNGLHVFIPPSLFFLAIFQNLDVKSPHMKFPISQICGLILASEEPRLSLTIPAYEAEDGAHIQPTYGYSRQLKRPHWHRLQDMYRLFLKTEDYTRWCQFLEKQMGLLRFNRAAGMLFWDWFDNMEDRQTILTMFPKTVWNMRFIHWVLICLKNNI